MLLPSVCKFVVADSKKRIQDLWTWPLKWCNSISSCSLAFGLSCFCIFFFGCTPKESESSRIVLHTNASTSQETQIRSEMIGYFAKVSFFFKASDWWLPCPGTCALRMASIKSRRDNEHFYCHMPRFLASGFFPRAYSQITRNSSQQPKIAQDS